MRIAPSVKEVIAACFIITAGFVIVAALLYGYLSVD